MTDVLAKLTTALADRYSIEREIGAGGMATVYLAHDVKHDRRVALKVLRPELAASLGSERFLREIKITAQLTHPHILPLLDSGTAEGLVYYVMPYADGESLRDRLIREKQLPLDDALRLTRETADALSYAHARGVVHRDIKPENILLAGAHAVVADFGIARAISVAGGDRLTSTGLSVGTPAYMSPEQAVGEQEIDGRSDVYALGCVLYEMLSGEPPFTGPTAQAIIARRMTQAPQPLRSSRETIPQWVDEAVARALARIPADRYATAEQFGMALLPPPASGKNAPRQRFARWPVIAAGVVALLIAAVTTVWIAPRLSRSTASPTVAPKIAVLPFENLGPPADEFFADGITEEITSRLADVSGLRVVSRTSSKRYKGSDASIRDVGKALGVDYVLEGTVRTDRSSDGSGQVRVTPQLIRVTDDVHLWTERYDAALQPGAIFGVQAKIASSVAGALNVTLLEPERRRLARVATEDSAAYHSYLLGRFHWEKRDRRSVLLAADYFRAAIAHDSNYALAYAGLSDAAAAYLVIFAPESGPEAWLPAIHAAERSVALDSMLAEAHASLGNALMRGKWAWAGAETALRHAITLDPEYGPARYWYAILLAAHGRREEAHAQAREAVIVDPLSNPAHIILGLNLGIMGRNEEALLELERAAELQQESYFIYFLLFHQYAELGRLEEATQTARRYLQALDRARPADDALVRMMTAVATGRADEATTLRLVSEGAHYWDNSTAAYWFALSGMRDSAFARLRTAVGVRTSRHTTLPLYKPLLEGDPRWAELLRSMGLPVW